MKKVTLALLALATGVGLMAGSYHLGISLAHADTPAVLDAGASAVPASAPADKLHDPIAHPIDALHDAQNGLKVGWAAGLSCIALLLIGALAWAGKKWPSVKWLAFFSKNKRAATVVACGSILAASVYNASMEGGAWTAALFAAGMKIAALFDSKSETPA